MKITSATFVGSSTHYTQCPQDNKPEIALMGRSNVGKSSLLNMLLARKELARISKKPGKTQVINHFLANKAWYLVDLPGYGWAQVSKAKRQQWEKMVRDYLLYRKNLACVFLLIDARLMPQKIDLNCTTWLGKKQIPFALLLTKADKPSEQKVQANLTALKRVLHLHWETLPPCFVTSSRNKIGLAALLNYIQIVLG